MGAGGRMPGAGRKKGTPGRKTIECYALAEKLGINPFEALLLFTANRWQELGYDSATKTKFTKDGNAIEVDQIEVSDRITAAHHACKYLFPQRKAVEYKMDEETLTSWAAMVKNASDAKRKTEASS